MPIVDCLKKMGFSKEESQAIIEDVGDGKASDVVKQHIALLEQERESILAQLKPAEPAKGEKSALYSAEALLANRPDITVPVEGGGVEPAAQALAKADAEIASAKQESQGYDAAVACALRG